MQMNSWWCGMRVVMVFSILFGVGVAVAKQTKDQFNFKSVLQDDDDYDHYDPDEFENFQATPQKQKSDKTRPSQTYQQDQTYYAETAAMLFIVVYAINFVIGKRQNEQIAQEWYDSVINTFQDQFAVIGDFEGEHEPVDLYKDSQSCFKFYASGRRYCGGLLATIELKKRHDLFSLALAMIDLSTSRDSLTIEIPMDEMEPFVFLVGHRRDESKWRKTLKDVVQYASQIPSTGLSKQYSILTDCPELEQDFMSPLVVRTLKETKNLFVMLHLTDQNSFSFGSARKILRFQFNFPESGDHQQLKKLIQMSIYFIDKVARVKLSPQARAKAQKARKRVEQERMRASHQERQEAYAKRKEDQKRVQEENAPELSKEQQRRKEQREHKQALKKRAPKLKIMSR